jgi:hypothetical protein
MWMSRDARVACLCALSHLACHSERSEEFPVGLRFFAALRMTASCVTHLMVSKVLSGNM